MKFHSAGKVATCFFCIGVTGMSIVQAKEARLPYKSQYQAIAINQDADARQYAMTTVRIIKSNAEVACPGATAWLELKAEKSPIAIAADGSTDMPLDDKWLDGELVVKKPDDAPPCQIITRLSYKIVPSTGMSYHQLFAGRNSINQYIKKQAGALSLFAPKLKGLELHFDKMANTELTISSEKKTSHLKAVDGSIKIEYDEKFDRDDTLLKIDTVPLSVDYWIN